MEITISPEEQIKKLLSEVHLAQAIDAIRTQGYVVLADVIDHAHLDILHARMMADSQELMAAQRWGGAGQVKGHLQQGTPPFAPYVFRDIVANPYAIQVTKAILGEGMYNRFYNGNTNTPDSGIQPLHRDGVPLWPNLAEPHPPCSLIINVFLVDVTEENGATELWPGTHLDTTPDNRIDAEKEASRREIVPPIRAVTRKGSLLIRDHRLWHRGMPNQSDVIRHMIAMIHNARWLQRPTTLLFNTGCEDAFPTGDLDHNVTFTAKPLNYLYSRFPVVAG